MANLSMLWISLDVAAKKLHIHSPLYENLDKFPPPSLVNPIAIKHKRVVQENFMHCDRR